MAIHWMVVVSLWAKVLDWLRGKSCNFFAVYFKQHASSTQMHSSTFLHSTYGYSTAEQRDECCWGSFATLRLGLAEGLGRPCLWQPHCLKLQKISWAATAARHWYDCSRIYSRPAELKLGLGLLGQPLVVTGRCAYSSWAVGAGGSGVAVHESRRP